MRVNTIENLAGFLGLHVVRFLRVPQLHLQTFSGFASSARSSRVFCSLFVFANWTGGYDCVRRIELHDIRDFSQVTGSRYTYFDRRFGLGTLSFREESGVVASVENRAIVATGCL